MNKLKKLTSLFVFLICSFIAFGQQDTIRKMVFSGLPGLSSSPETGISVAGFSQLSFDLYKNNLDSRMSQIKFGGGYSIKKQLQLISSILLFGKDEKYIIRSRIEYRNWVDRHYGLGNDASNQIVEYNFENSTIDTLNFMNFGVNYLQFNGSYSKKIGEGLFAGIQTDIYNGSGFSPLADSVVLNTDEIDASTILGQFYGLGFNITYDTRDNVNSAREGSYIQFSNFNYRKWLGGDFEFYNFSLDARTYINTIRNHTLALHGLFGMTFSEDVIPYVGYQRMGGEDVLRGYFEGTYSDKHLMFFDVEYRFPLFLDNDSPGWKIWKHLSVVVFFGGGQVADELSNLGFSNFRLSTGGGIRIQLSKSQRAILRLDYGVGLQADAAGIGKKQRGFYLSVSEAF